MCSFATGETVSLTPIEKITLLSQAQGLLDSLDNAGILEKITIQSELASILQKLGGSVNKTEAINFNEFAVKGKSTKVFTPKGDEVLVAYHIIELSGLIPSNTPDGRVNPLYSEELQPRDRTRKTSIMQVDKIAGGLQPQRLTSSELTSHGSPIVGPDYMVESGNGRAMAITKAYSSNNGDEYKLYLHENANKFGIQAATIAGMNQPVLVRVRLTKLDRLKFARDSNVSDLQSMSSTEQAIADAETISANMLSLFNPSESGDVFGVDNRAFIDAFVNEIGLENSASLFDEHGHPNRQLQERVKAAIFVKAYKNKKLAALAVESADPEIVNILNALSSAASDFVEMQSLNSAIHDQVCTNLSNELAQYSETPSAERTGLVQEALSALVKATELVRESKRSNQPIEALISQNDLFNEGDPAAEALAMFIKANNRSAKRMSYAFRQLAKEINAKLIHKGSAIGDLFGDPQELTLVDVLSRVNDKITQEFGSEVKTIEMDRIDLKANASATSFSSNQTQPSQAQKEAGNYKKGRVQLAGFDITIENPKGSIRKGVSESGETWSIKMNHHYGDLKGTKGADGDALDVFLGRELKPDKVFILDQINPETRRFDEHKIMLGFASMAEARNAYLSNYDEKWQGLGAIKAFTLEKFRQWVESGNTKVAVKYVEGELPDFSKNKSELVLDPKDYETYSSRDLKIAMLDADSKGHSLESVSLVMDYWLTRNQP